MPYAWWEDAATGKIGNSLVVAMTLGNISVRRRGIGDIERQSISRTSNLYQTIPCWMQTAANLLQENIKKVTEGNNMKNITYFTLSCFHYYQTSESVIYCYELFMLPHVCMLACFSSYSNCGHDGNTHFCE